MFKNTEPMYQIYVQLFALSVRSHPCIYYLYPVLNKYFSTIDILYIYMDRQIVYVSTYRQMTDCICKYIQTDCICKYIQTDCTCKYIQTDCTCKYIQTDCTIKYVYTWKQTIVLHSSWRQ